MSARNMLHNTINDYVMHNVMVYDVTVTYDTCYVRVQPLLAGLVYNRSGSMMSGIRWCISECSGGCSSECSSECNSECSSACSSECISECSSECISECSSECSSEYSSEFSS